MSTVEPPPERDPWTEPEEPTEDLAERASQSTVHSQARRRARGGLTPDRGILLLWSAGVFVLALILILRLT